MTEVLSHLSLLSIVFVFMRRGGGVYGAIYRSEDSH